ncbi:MAG: SWI/SNF-related matrix-associated actin-dependent regulator of chromatin subfamily A-like protein 1, partial [Thermoleophilaceae bacterium]|nr:SWI/SNF-related matrix-associated actin-dependent regulator of chromatin subfamily A-like protein 1 [Thermoleophilaceae bacterium]
RRVWLIPIDQPVAQDLSAILARHRWLSVSPELAGWLRAVDGWEGTVTVDELNGEPCFAIETLHGDPPPAIAAAPLDERDFACLPLTRESAELLEQVEGAYLDRIAETCANNLMEGRNAAAATLWLRSDEEGESRFELEIAWGARLRDSFLKIPQAVASSWDDSSYVQEEIVYLPADAALIQPLDAWLGAHPGVALDVEAEGVLADLREEHAAAEATVALSRAHDAPIEVLRLGGELRPFQRAGVQYALEQRRTFIADEQGLGKTVQALAALEAADAYPAVVVAPAGIKLNWQRETERWLPHRSVAVLSGRGTAAWRDPALETAEIVVLNYEIVAAHAERLAARGLQAAIFDESHYCKQPRAKRTKAAIALADSVAPGGLRLALTGTPVLNRPKELIAQLRLLGRLRDFGTGAAFARRFEDDAGHERLHWHLRSRCYVRRRKDEVLPQLPPKRQETVAVELSNATEYRLAESDVIAWLQQRRIAPKERDAKVAAALRAERLAQLNALRMLAGSGKVAAAIAWIDDWVESDEPLVVFADHIDVQQALVARFPDALHLLGTDSMDARQKAIDAFQRPGGPALIICSLKAAGHGVTLTRASNVAFVELDWTPARLEQAEDRLHRIGQRDSVTAWYLIAPDTIDATMAAVIDRKRQVIGAVTDGRVYEDAALIDAVISELIARRG